MNKINVIGIGPGSRELITPLAWNILKKSDIVIGGRRNLDLIGPGNYREIEIKGSLDLITEVINEQLAESFISVAVSGDPGFYSMFRFLKRNFGRELLNVIPGISSIQYMFAKIGLSYENAYIGSAHGREPAVPVNAESYPAIAFLTDNKNTPQKIAALLVANNIKMKKIYVGINLSLSDEKILIFRTEELIGLEKKFDLNVMVVSDE